MVLQNIVEVSDTVLKKRAKTNFESGDICFIIMAGALVLFMIPGLSFLYSGLARRKSSLSLIWVVSASNAVCIFQWYLWGYSLAFSPTATNGFMGNFKNFGLMGVLGDPSPGSSLIPALLYAFYQMECACVTVAILVGGIAERGRLLPAMVFTFLWMTLVYCPIACWAWNINGWGFKLGVLDFAGGGPVEIGSGVGGLAYTWVLGPRQDKALKNFRPQSISMVNLGTFILWFGWLGFNAGGAFGANMRAVMAVWNSMLAAGFGGLAWCALDYRLERKYSMVGLCSGIICGLIVATSASGYVQPWAAILMGVSAGTICNFATKVKFYLGVDDSLDIFAQHGVGGILGLLTNAFFASHSVIALDGVSTNAGGWVDHNWRQLYVQLAYIVAASSYTFVVTALLAHYINTVPGLHLRTTAEGEALGLDEVEIGEYANDYIETCRDVMEQNCAQSESTTDTIQFIMPEPIAVADDRYRRPHLENKSQRRAMHIEDVLPDTEKPVELLALKPGVTRVSIIP